MVKCIHLLLNCDLDPVVLRNPFQMWGHHSSYLLLESLNFTLQFRPQLEMDLGLNCKVMFNMWYEVHVMNSSCPRIFSFWPIDHLSHVAYISMYNSISGLSVLSYWSFLLIPGPVSHHLNVCIIINFFNIFY